MEVQEAVQQLLSEVHLVSDGLQVFREVNVPCCISLIAASV